MYKILVKACKNPHIAQIPFNIFISIPIRPILYGMITTILVCSTSLPVYFDVHVFL